MLIELFLQERFGLRSLASAPLGLLVSQRRYEIGVFKIDLGVLKPQKLHLGFPPS